MMQGRGTAFVSTFAERAVHITTSWSIQARVGLGLPLWLQFRKSNATVNARISCSLPRFKAILINANSVVCFNRDKQMLLVHHVINTVPVYAKQN